jgi:hypothetical protein
MPIVTVNSISFSKANGGITDVTYEYTIDCNQGECNKETYALTVSLVGVDQWWDDDLGGSMDLHKFTCTGKCPVTITRTFPVSTKVLDEDWGEDEIKLVLWVSDGSGLPTSASITSTGNRF